MSSISSTVGILTVILACTACLPTDSPVTPHPRTSTSIEVKLGDTYAVQAFVDLSSNSVVHSQPIDTWHLSVDCEAPHFVRLNDALIMSAVNTQTADWASVTKKPRSGFMYEPASGMADSIPLREFWQQANGVGSVFIVHLGIDVQGKDLGYVKIQAITSIPRAVFRYGSLDGTLDTTITLDYDSKYRRVGFDAITLSPIQVEPPASQWDVLLSRYTYMFHTETGDLPYAVVGALVQQPMVRATRTTTSFTATTSSDTTLAPLRTVRDAIGHEWKYFDLTNETYTVDTTAVYLIRDRFGYVYALRFLDFYNRLGKKGTITFEQRML